MGWSFTGSLDFVEALGEFEPIIFQRIFILELFPRPALVWTVHHWEGGEKIVAQPHGQCLMRDGDVNPIF